MAKEIKTISYSASTKIVYPQSYNFEDCGSLGWGGRVGGRVGGKEAGNKGVKKKKGRGKCVHLEGKCLAFEKLINYLKNIAHKFQLVSTYKEPGSHHTCYYSNNRKRLDKM